MVFALLLSSILWNLGTWYLGLPASSSHTLIGSIVGVGLMNSLMSPGSAFGEGVNWAKVEDTVKALVFSPLLGFVAAALLLLAAKALLRNPALYKAPEGDKPPPIWIRGLLVLTCTGVSFAHGSNDGQKGMGLIVLILVGIVPTAFALNLAENVGVHGNKPVAIFSLEMSKESLLLRLLSADAKIDSHKFRTGHLNHEDKARIPKSLTHLSEAPLWIDDAGSATVVEMGAKLRRMKRERGLSLVIVDYLQLVSARGKFGNRNEEISSITRGLKAMAKELKVPMLVLSQLTRAPEREDREPRLADLRESGAIEQDADVVMFIHRPNFFKKSSEVSMEERGETDLIIAKQRNGPTDTIRFVFQGSYTRFEQRAPDAWTEPE